MEINMKSFVCLSLSFLFLFVNVVHADDLERLELNFEVDDLETIEPNFEVSDEINTINKKNFSNGPLDGIDISFDQIFKYQDQRVIEIENRTNQTIQDSAVKRESGFYLGTDEYIEIRGLDKRRKLFNGSIIIEFTRMPNLNAFALENGITLVADLSDIKRGVFKLGNLYELEDKINELQSNENVLTIDLDTLDPNIKAQ